MLTRPNLDVPIDGPLLFAFRLALTFGIAELSFRFFEMPIRRGAIDILDPATLERLAT